MHDVACCVVVWFVVVWVVGGCCGCVGVADDGVDISRGDIVHVCGLFVGWWVLQLGWAVFVVSMFECVLWCGGVCVVMAAINVSHVLPTLVMAGAPPWVCHAIAGQTCPEDRACLCLSHGHGFNLSSGVWRQTLVICRLVVGSCDSERQQSKPKSATSTGIAKLKHIGFLCNVQTELQQIPQLNSAKQDRCPHNVVSG